MLKNTVHHNPSTTNNGPLTNTGVAIMLDNPSTSRNRGPQLENTATVAPRLALIDPGAAPKATADAFKLLPVINVFRAMANAETLFPPYFSYLARLFKPLELDKAVERMMVLRVAKQSDCFYIWRQNVVVGHSVGVTDEQIAALDKGDIKASCFTPAHQAAFAFTDEVMNLIEATDQTYDAAKRYFSDRALTEMLYLIGTYMFLARVIRTGRVALDDEPAPAPQH